MRFGINSFLVVSPFTNKSTPFFKQFKKWGFQSVEIPVEDPSHMDPVHVKAELDQAGLVCGTVCACLGPGRDLRGNAQEQKTAMDYLKTLVDYAVVLGSPNIIGPFYSYVGRADAYSPKQKQQHWKLVVRNLKALCKYAEKNGVQFCLEPLNRFETDFINTVDQALRMVKDVNSPALKILLDTFHMNIEEKDQSKAIRKAGKHLAHLHACGCDRGTPGADHIDWTGIAKALKAIKYQGDVVIESFGPDVKVVAKAAAIWRPLAKKDSDIATKGLAFLKKTLG